MFLSVDLTLRKQLGVKPIFLAFSYGFIIFVQFSFLWLHLLNHLAFFVPLSFLLHVLPLSKCWGPFLLGLTFFQKNQIPRECVRADFRSHWKILNPKSILLRFKSSLCVSERRPLHRPPVSLRRPWTVALYFLSQRLALGLVPGKMHFKANLFFHLKMDVLFVSI